MSFQLFFTTCRPSLKCNWIHHFVNYEAYPTISLSFKKNHSFYQFNHCCTYKEQLHSTRTSLEKISTHFCGFSDQISQNGDIIWQFKMRNSNNYNLGKEWSSRSLFTEAMTGKCFRIGIYSTLFLLGKPILGRKNLTKRTAIQPNNHSFWIHYYI